MKTSFKTLTMAALLAGAGLTAFAADTATPAPATPVAGSHAKEHGHRMDPAKMDAMHAKRTAELIPLCHPLMLSKIAIAFEFEDRIIPASMSVRAASVLRITNCLGFLNNMVMALVNIIMHEELCSEGVVMHYISDVTPGAKASAKNSMIDFGQLLRQLTTITDFTETLNSIPDITIDAKDVAAAFGTSLDPFNLGSSGLGFRGNPVYWVGMLAAEWQHGNYKVNEQRKRALEKRLIALKRAQQGTPSPQIERDLEVISSDIARIDERLRGYEEKIK